MNSANNNGSCFGLTQLSLHMMNEAECSNNSANTNHNDQCGFINCIDS